MQSIFTSEWFKKSFYFTLAAILVTLVPVAPIAVMGGVCLITILPGAQLLRWLGLYRQSWDFRAVTLSVGLGLVTSPLLIYWSSLLLGFNRWTLLAIFGGTILALAGWVSRNDGQETFSREDDSADTLIPALTRLPSPESGEATEGRGVRPPGQYGWQDSSPRLWLITALLISVTALGVYLAYFELETERGYYPVQMEDWQKHYGVAFALRYTGVPPTSMFFYGMFPNDKLVYYYFLHLSGATLDLWQSGEPFLHESFVLTIVLASLSFSSMFFLLAQALFRSHKLALWSLAFATVIGGLDVIPTLQRVIQKYRENFPEGPLPAGVLFPREHIDNWVSALSLRLNTFFGYHIWVPQHLTGLTILCLGCYLYLNVTERRKLLVIYPCLLFALLGHSTWIAVMVAGCLFLFGLIQIATTYRRQGLAEARTLFFSYALIALGFVAIAAPFILSLIGPQAPKSGLAFEIPTLNSWWPLRPFQATFGPTVWARLLDLPIHFFIEMGALLIAGLAGLILYCRSTPADNHSTPTQTPPPSPLPAPRAPLSASRSPLPAPRFPLPASRSSLPALRSPLPAPRSLLPFWLLLLVSGILTISFFASGRAWSNLGLTTNNDLGLRAFMPGQLVLALFAGYFMGQLGQLALPRWWRVTLLGGLSLLIALGVMYTGWEFTAMGLAKYTTEPQLSREVYETLRALPEVTQAQDKAFPVVQHRLHRDTSRFQLSLGRRPVGISADEAVIFHPDVQPLALAIELSEQAFDNELPVRSYQLFRNLGADYIFVGPAEREAIRHPEKYQHPQYFERVYRQGDFEIYQLQPPLYTPDRPQAQFDAGAIQFKGFFIDNFLVDPAAPAAASSEPAKGLVTAWRLTRPADKDYTAFIHLVDANGNILAQADHQLWAWDVKSEGPTTTWTPGLTHLDVVPLPEAALHLEAPLSIRLGLWLPETGQHFPVESSTLDIDEGNRLVVGRLGL